MFARRKQDCDSVEQQSSVQDPGAHSQQEEKMSRDKVKIRLCEINKHVSDGINKDLENQNGAKEFSKSEGEWVDVMHTLQHAISIIEKEIAKNFAFLQKERPKVKSLQRTVLMRRRTTEQITDVSRGNTAS